MPLPDVTPEKTPSQVEYDDAQANVMRYLEAIGNQAIRMKKQTLQEGDDRIGYRTLVNASVARLFELAVSDEVLAAGLTPTCKTNLAALREKITSGS